MIFIPDDDARNLLILERVLMEAERMLPQEEHERLASLISSGTPEEVVEFIRGRLPVADLVERVRAA